MFKSIQAAILISLFHTPFIASGVDYSDPDGTFLCETSFHFESDILAEERQNECLSGPPRICASDGRFDVPGPAFESVMFKKGEMEGREVDYYRISSELSVPGSQNGRASDFILSFSYTHHRETRSKTREVYLGLVSETPGNQSENTFKFVPGRGIVGTELRPGETIIHSMNKPQGIIVRGKYPDQRLEQIEVRCLYRK